MSCPLVPGTETVERRNGGALYFWLFVTRARIGLWRCVNACRVSPGAFPSDEKVNSGTKVFLIASTGYECSERSFAR
jgi:hypothetical protein